MDLKEATAAWFRKKTRTWTPKVSKDVARHVARWVRVWDPVEMAGLTPVMVERLELELDDGKRSGSRINSVRTYLRQFLSYCRNMGWGPEGDPTREWKWRNQEVKREYAPLTREEEERMCAVAPPWLVKFVRLGICTGQREGTIRKLTWEMVKAREGGGWMLEIPAAIMKQRKAHRMPLAERAVTALGARGEGLLIPDMPANAELVWDKFKRVGRQAGINPRSSPHDLKRTTVQRLSEAGIPIQKIMALIGNKSIGVILKHYCCEIRTNEAKETLDLV